MRIIILFFIFLLNACATQVSSLKKDGSVILEQHKGFILLGIQTNQNLKEIHISGPKSIKLTSKDIKQGTQYLFIDLESGIYTIDRIMLDNYWRVTLDNEEMWQFEVSPGKINYVGHLEFVRRGYWYPVTQTELVNRSSESLEYLEENFPIIYKNNSMSYGGPGQDDFFNYLTLQVKE